MKVGKGVGMSRSMGPAWHTHAFPLLRTILLSYLNLPEELCKLLIAVARCESDSIASSQPSRTAIMQRKMVAVLELISYGAVGHAFKS